MYLTDGAYVWEGTGGGVFRQRACRKKCFIFQINFIHHLYLIFTRSPALLRPLPPGDFKYLFIHKINLGKLDNHYNIIYNYLKIQFLFTKAPI